MATRSEGQFKSSEMPTKKPTQTTTYDALTWSLRDRQSRQTFNCDVSVAGNLVEGAPSPHSRKSQFLFYVPIAAAGDPQEAENSHLQQLPLPLPPPPPPPPPLSPPPPPPPPPSPPLPPVATSSLPLLEADDEMVRAAGLYQFDSDIPLHIAQHWDLAHHCMWSDCIQLESDEEI
ncbi:uncharacterized protein BJ212DRAFT_1485649 [Suillus subaureus]|uniref:Uncharacterized protein n=1 Tax=Suillus subaureus TaxID=48587 RepID=A0A9P7E0B5_9AGAM|nr:uncharacterized protein BJ212DRAFT_1485649 [Suillus subaureus]KAG1807531.1 hypothetical protein BJ212DRAFT_1485649 [Suillus subaureus]